jgi:hypothetical protein
LNRCCDHHPRFGHLRANQWRDGNRSATRGLLRKTRSHSLQSLSLIYAGHN